MNKTTYLAARRLIRDNGRSALRWMGEAVRAEMDRLLTVQDTTDWLAERASILDYCAVVGCDVNVRHTRPGNEYRGGRWVGVQA